MAKAGSGQKSGAGAKLLRAILGGTPRETEQPGGGEDPRAEEDRRFRRLLEELPPAPSAHDLRALMSASYRAGRYVECKAIVGYYEKKGFEITDFVERTKEMLRRHDVVDLGRIFAEFEPQPLPATSDESAIELSTRFETPDRGSEGAFAADLSILALTGGKTLSGELENGPAERQNTLRFSLEGGQHLVVVVIPTASPVPAGTTASLRREGRSDWARRSLLGRVFDGHDFAVCAFFTKASGGVEISVQDDDAAALDFDWDGARVWAIDVDGIGDFSKEQAPFLNAQAAVRSRLAPLDVNSSAATIDELIDTVRRSAYSTRAFALLLAANLSRPEHDRLYAGWRRRVANVLLRDDATAEDAYQVVNALMFRFRELRLASEISSRVLTVSPKGLRPARRQKFEQFAGRAIMLDRQPSFPTGLAPAFEPEEKSVLYCLHQARPFDTNGYAVRSHALLKALGKTGWNVEGVTRAGYALEGRSPDEPVEVENVRYHAVRGPDLSLVSDWGYVHAAADELERVVRRERPAIVHAASSHANAWPALIAARRCGLPFVYEVRGFWEMSQAAKEPWTEGSHVARLTVDNDTRIAKEADAVLVLTEAMKREMIARGVAGDKITVAPNAVDLDDFGQPSGDRARLATLGLDPELPTVGYVGSIVAYEGLELLVEALAKVRDAGVAFNLLLVGDGNALNDVKEAIARLGLADRAVCTGRVPRDEANALYELIDICPFPRLPLPVSEHVSPLKPFEAMAQGKAIVGSDVAAIAEFVSDGDNGRLFAKGDSESLAKVLESLLADPESIRSLGDQARRWVREHRQWSGTAATIAEVYQRLADRKSPAAAPRDRTPYALITHRQPVGLLAARAGDWITVTGRAAPLAYDEEGAQIVFTVTHDAGKRMFATPQEAQASGFEASKSGAELVAVPTIDHDGRYRFRARLPEAEGPYRLSWAPGAKQAFFADGEPEVAIDEVVERRVVDRRLRIAIIADKFTTAALSGVADCLPLSRADYRREIAENDIDLFICESAWEGNDGQWRHGVGYYGEEESEDLRGVLDACREKGIPTAFFNKEDPVHFKRFNKAAAMFDHVVTTDLDMVPAYLRLPNSRIKTAVAKPFFASPAVHHPFSDEERQNDFCYAGTYYGKRYADRTAQLDMMLDAAADTGKLVIYDRYADIEDSPYRLPDHLKPFSKGGLDYQGMLKAYRKHGTFLNANSVPDSETMFSRRVVEALSSGAAVVTATSRAVRKQLHGRVPEVDGANDSNRLLTSIERHPELRRFYARSGMRVVLRDLSAARWLSDIAHSAGIDVSGATDLPTYSVTFSASECSDDAAFLALVDDLVTQSVAPHAITIEKADGIDPTTRRKADRMANEAGVDLHFGTSENEHAQGSTFVVRIDPHRWHGATCMEDVLVLDAFGDADALVASPRDDVDFSWDAADVDGLLRLERRQPSSGKAIVAPRFALGDERPSAKGRKLLIAGHDLKFIAPFYSHFERAGFELLIDQWQGHGEHDEAQSRKLLEEADIVFCEWMLGNARWYGQHVRPDQPLIGRLHLQETSTDYPRHYDIERFDRVFYVGTSTMEDALETFGWERRGRDIVLGNAIDMEGLDLSKLPDARFALGFVGMVPARKRIDRALDILRNLRAIDPRFHLRVKGKKPSEYSWLAKREDEAAYYAAFWQRLKEDPFLQGAVRFDGHGPDMPEWFRKIGFALSTSDFESFHLTVADGAASRAVPVVLPWEGADEIYPADWVDQDEDAAARRILDLSRDEARWAAEGDAARKVIGERYAIADIADRMVRQILQVVPQ